MTYSIYSNKDFSALPYVYNYNLFDISLKQKKTEDVPCVQKQKKGSVHSLIRGEDTVKNSR